MNKIQLFLINNALDYELTNSDLQGAVEAFCLEEDLDFNMENKLIDDLRDLREILLKY